MVWPFLLAGAAICAYWNLKAGLSFAVCILLVRAGVYFELNNPLLFRMVLYSVTAFVVLFFVDRVAGGFFALVGIALALALLGIMGVRTQLIASEAVLLVGMLASAWAGPTGGIYNPVSHSGRPTNMLLASVDIQKDTEGHQGKD